MRNRRPSFSHSGTEYDVYAVVIVRYVFLSTSYSLTPAMDPCFVTSMPMSLLAGDQLNGQKICPGATAGSGAAGASAVRFASSNSMPAAFTPDVAIRFPSGETTGKLALLSFDITSR